jgi:hypothetical protein
VCGGFGVSCDLKRVGSAMARALNACGLDGPVVSLEYGRAGFIRSLRRGDWASGVEGRTSRRTLGASEFQS